MMQMFRTAVVKTMNVGNVVSSSILNIGDVVRYQAKSNALAIQREFPIYAPNEAPLSMFPIYCEPIPLLKPKREVVTVKYNEMPLIQVEHIDITSAADSSALIVGSCVHMTLTARVKNIRHFIFPPHVLSKESFPLYPIDRFTGIIL